MRTDDLGSQGGHNHADLAREEPARPRHPLEVSSNRIMIAFMIGSAGLLASVSLWVFAHFSPQSLRLGLGSQQTIAAAPSRTPTARPMPSPTPRPAPLPIAVPSSVPPNLGTPSVPTVSPSPRRTTSPPTTIVDLPQRATEPTSTAIAAPTVTPAAATVPAAPTNVTATAGYGTATVSWMAPTASGGSTITTYTITPYVGTTAQAPTVITGVPLATSATVTGLTNGTTYTFTVSATNSIGTGPDSVASNAITPISLTVPEAPTNLIDTAGNGEVTLSWTAPADGGSTITSYTITPSTGAVAQTPTVISGGPPATSATITGLTNGTTYTFIITATNAIGTGPSSAESDPVTPG